MNHMLLRSLGVCLVLSGCWLYAAEKENDPSILRMKSDIFFLAGEECEGRGIETNGINKAADHIAKTFKDLGLQPAQKDGSYFQPFGIAGTTKLGSNNRVVLAGPNGKKVELKLNEQFSVCGLSNKGKVKAELVFVGYGITTNPKKYDDYEGIDVKGKIVVILRKTPRANAATPFVPDGENYGPLMVKIMNAEQHGAAGLIFLNERSAAKDNNDELMTYEYSRGGGAGTIPVVHLKRSALEPILNMAGKVSLVDMEAGIDRGLKPMSIPLTGWTANIETNIEKQELPAKNVVAVLPGKGPLADEFVVIGAHYDHLGRGERGSLSRGSKDIHFGADDNASGTTGVLELARRFAAMKDREGRTIVFMTFSGEERGLLGSAYYCNKNPLLPLDRTVAMINLDMIGRLRKDDKTQKDKIEIGGIGSAKEFEAQLDKLNEKYQLDIKKTRSGVGPSDHTSFYNKGVPVFFFFTMLHPEYHRPTDKPETINLDGMKKIVDMVEELTMQLTTSKEKPTYVKMASTGRGRDGSGSPGPMGPRLGIAPGEYDDDETRGMPVGSVTPGGAAEKGGVKAGDWIVEIGGQPVKNVAGYMTQMAKQKKGEEVEIVVDRKGQKVKLKVTPE